MKKNELILALKKMGLNLDEEKINQLEAFCNLLIEENKKTNLTAIKTKEEVYLKHVYDSLTLVKGVNFNEIKRMLDLGSGAGFPGLVIKIVFPNLVVTLVEANNKKCTFLNKVVNILELTKINIIQQRAEDYVKTNRESFDLVVARAVANIRILSELCLPLTKVNGNFIAMKAHVEEELITAKETIEVLGGNIKDIIIFKLPMEGSLRTLVKIEKVNKTAMEFPRKYDKILKYPLKKN